VRADLPFLREEIDPLSGREEVEDGRYREGQNPEDAFGDSNRQDARQPELGHLIERPFLLVAAAAALRLLGDGDLLLLAEGIPELHYRSRRPCKGAGPGHGRRNERGRELHDRSRCDSGPGGHHERGREQ